MSRILTTLKAKVDPAHAALLVVDVQNDFCAKGGAFDKEGIEIPYPYRTIVYKEKMKK